MKICPADIYFPVISLCSAADILRFCEAFGEMFNGIVIMSFGIGIIVTVATYLLVRYLLQTQLNLE